MVLKRKQILNHTQIGSLIIMTIESRYGGLIRFGQRERTRLFPVSDPGMTRFCHCARKREFILSHMLEPLILLLLMIAARASTALLQRPCDEQLSICRPASIGGSAPNSIIAWVQSAGRPLYDCCRSPNKIRRFANPVRVHMIEGAIICCASFAISPQQPTTTHGCVKG